MDRDHFDRFSSQFAAACSRRESLTFLMGSLLGGIAMLLAPRLSDAQRTDAELAAGSTIAAGGCSSGSNPDQHEIYVYSLEDFLGACETVTSDAAEIGIASARSVAFQSIKVGSDVYGIGYELTGFGGKWKEFGPATASSRIYPSIRSIRICTDQLCGEACPQDLLFYECGLPCSDDPKTCCDPDASPFCCSGAAHVCGYTCCVASEVAPCGNSHQGKRKHGRKKHHRKRCNGGGGGGQFVRLRRPS